MCAGVLTHMGNRSCMMSEIFPSLLSEKKRAGLRTFFLTQTIAACNSTGLSTNSVYQYSDYLSTVRCYSHRRLISRFRCGCHGLHVDTGRFGKDSEHRSREDRVCLVCMSGSVEDELHFLFDCPAYSHILQQYSHLCHQASSSVAAFLATNQPYVVGSYLKTCFAQRQSVLASPLLVWLLNFVELD